MQYLIKMNTQSDIYFPLIKAGSNDFATSSDYTPAAGDCYLSQNGGTFNQATNTITYISNGIWKLTLTAAETLTGTLIVSVIDSATKAIEDQCILCFAGLWHQLEAGNAIDLMAVDDATFTPTTSAFEALMIAPNETEEATADHYNGRNIAFISGALRGQMCKITDYALDNSKCKFTVTTLTEAPADGDKFVVL